MPTAPTSVTPCTTTLPCLQKLDSTAATPSNDTSPALEASPEGAVLAGVSASSAVASAAPVTNTRAATLPASPSSTATLISPSGPSLSTVTSNCCADALCRVSRAYLARSSNGFPAATTTPPTGVASAPSTSNSALRSINVGAHAASDSAPGSSHSTTPRIRGLPSSGGTSTCVRARTPDGTPSANSTGTTVPPT